VHDLSEWMPASAVYSMFYDPLICKLVTHGKTRHDAIARVTAAVFLLLH